MRNLQWAIPAFLLLLPVPGVFADAFTEPAVDVGRGELGLWLPPEPTQREPYSTWNGEIEFGALSTSGNTKSDSAHARARVTNDRLYWRHSLRGEWTYADTHDLPPAEQHRVSQKTAYKLTDDDYAFEAVRYDRAEARGIRYRFTEVLGYGRRLYQQKNSFLVLEAGSGGRQTRATDSGAELHEAIGVVQAEFNWQWEAGSTFNTYLVVEFGEINTLTISQSSLTLRIRGNVSARFNYDVTANTDVPEGIEKIDRVVSAALVYQI